MKKNDLYEYEPLVVMLLIVVGVYVGSWVFIDKCYSDPNVRGTFGDKFGAVNALFSGFAFAGLIYTIIMQKKDLNLQREELRLTKEEMARQTKVFEAENKTMQLQRFENTFFNLMSQFETITNQITYSYIEDKSGKQYFQEGEEQYDQESVQRITISGREVFRIAFEEVPHFTSVKEDSILPKGMTKCMGMRELLGYKGMSGYLDSFTPTYFDHYFRFLYRILRFVDETDKIEEHDKYRYTCLLRAMLSRYELIWLYYNGLSDYGFEKLKPLIEKYAMLNNLRLDMLVDGLDIGVYDSRAFEHHE